jgi:hypothetical protein
MSSPLLSAPVGLILNLPPLQPDQYYQLTLVGNLRRVSSSPLNRELDVYFQRTVKTGNQYVALGGAPRIRRVNLHHAASLKVGTLWTDKGVRHTHSQQAIQDFREFSLGPFTDLCSTSLRIVLPELSSRKAYKPIRQFLTDELLHSLKDLPVTTLMGLDGELLIIPQFELARAFYLWAGPKLIDFLFHPTRTSHICDPIQAPTVQNELAAKVLIRPSELDPGNVFDLDHRFSDEQVLILAQMRFDVPFRRAIERLRVQQEIADSEGAEVPLKLDLALSKQVKVKANGIPFEYRGQRFFWVCSLFERGNYCCFNQLDYTTLVEYRPTQQSAIKNSALLPQAGISSQLDLRNNPHQDSSQPGHASSGGPDVLLDTGDTLEIPLIQRNMKAVKQSMQTSRRGHRTLLPQVLTQRGEGKDLDTVKVNMRPAWETMDALHYFENIIREFINRGYIAVRLQINNTKSTFGVGFSVPADTQPGTAPYQVGIACIQRSIDKKVIYGYFFHVLHSSKKRSAFLHRSSLEEFTTAQFNWVLNGVKLKEDDWVETRKYYEAAWEKMVTEGKRQGGIRPGLILHARNHKSIELDVERCINELIKELSL